jgi:hypothetical protein
MSEEAGLAHEDRYCDLVMKGGITSGVVYPPAICALAEHYRFKNIGGTSAGAIAAAVTAAAEYYRRYNAGSLAGFERLAKLPGDLGEKGNTSDTQLLRLFQPDPPCRRLFRILIGSLNAKSTYRRIAAIVWGCIAAYWPTSVVAVLAGSLIGWLSASYLAGLLCWFMILVGETGYLIYRDITRHVVDNNYGLCKGLTTTPASGDALTPWLHTLIQKTAGRSATDAPLTFGDLWAAPGFPPSWIKLSDPERAAARSINLEMFTTNLSHGRPYLFPHLEPTARLFFNPLELRAYLPETVLSWLVSHARPYTEERRSNNSDPPVKDAVDLGLLEIPEARDFPIVLAARMSLSFPILFSAVPFWAIDYEDRRKARTFRRCLFADGGISSNFPVHLFDGLVPSWPTFAIQLEPALPNFPGPLFLPHEYGQGIADRWTRFDQAEKSPSRLGGFLMSIVSTMQNWNDNVLSRMPGVRDRVVRLRLNDREGGINLNMDPDLIADLGKRGAAAAAVLLHRFQWPAIPNEQLEDQAVPSPLDAADAGRSRTTGWNGWDFQRWVRLDVLLRTVADKSNGLCCALGQPAHSATYHSLLQQAQAIAPPGHAAPLTAKEAEAVRMLIDALETTARVFEERAFQYPNTPIPQPDLRVRPSL